MRRHALKTVLLLMSAALAFGWMHGRTRQFVTPGAEEVEIDGNDPSRIRFSFQGASDGMDGAVVHFPTIFRNRPIEVHLFDRDSGTVHGLSLDESTSNRSRRFYKLIPPIEESRGRHYCFEIAFMDGSAVRDGETREDAFCVLGLTLSYDADFGLALKNYRRFHALPLPILWTGLLFLGFAAVCVLLLANLDPPAS